MWTPPPTSTLHLPGVIHVMSIPRPSPILTALPLLCITLNANQRTNSRGGLGTRLNVFIISHKLPNHPALNIKMLDLSSMDQNVVAAVKLIKVSVHLALRFCSLVRLLDLQILLAQDQDG